jgi:Protein of unknown function (DUF3667)
MEDESSIVLNGVPEDSGLPEEIGPSCRNCNAPAHGAYCHECGQKHRTPHEYRLLHFMKHALQEFTDIDSKALQSFRYLLFSPGRLTAEWRAGREGSFIKPVRLFIVINIIYFLFLHFFPVNTIVVPLESQYNQQGYSRFIRPIVDRQVKASHVSFEKFSEAYDEVSSEQAKTLVILMVPMFAVLLVILYVRKHLYFVEHLVFSLHFYAFFLLLISIGSWLINALILQGFNVFGYNIHDYILDWDSWLTYSDGGLIIFYLILALKKVYGGNVWANAIRAIFLSYGVLYVLFLYRFILFFTTIYMPTKF